MKILMANNHNYIRGGAEKVYFDEINLLRERSHEVFELSYNDSNSLKYHHQNPDLLNDFDTNIFKRFSNIFWNYDAERKLELIVNSKKIQIFHGHNIHTRLSPSIICKAKELGLKTIITLHDLKYVCPHYSMLYNNKICEDCRGGTYYHAILNKCHKDSRVKSAIVAAELYNFDRLKLDGKVDTFISPSKFLITKYKDMGFKGNMTYIPNFVETRSLNNATTGKNYIFVGRLSYEKGILTLLEAFKNNNFTLDIVGDGPLLNELVDFVKRNNFKERITFHGHLPTNKVLEMVLNAKALILPSETYENAPISILEAMSYGKIILGSNLGGIPEMIHEGKNGFSFTSGNAHQINESIDKVESLSTQEIQNFSNFSLELVNTVFSKETHYNNLRNLYEGKI